MMRQDSPGSIDVRTEPGGNTNLTVLPVSQTALVVMALLLGAVGFVASMFAWQIASSSVSAVSASARDAGFAAAKAETATARANTAEIYAKQIYTELNRLGYPVKTPAEDHAPQPPEPLSQEPGK